MGIIHRILKQIDIIATQELFGSVEYVVPCERIVFVPGIDMQSIKMQWWERDLQNAFPRVSVKIFHAYYLHTQHRRVERYIEELTELLADGIPTVVLAHSFGGLLAKGAIHRLEGKTSIALLLTLASPHTMHDYGIAEAITALHIPQSVAVPIITYGGTYDVIVPEKYTHCPGEREHHAIPYTHIGFLYNANARAHSIRCIQRFLYQD